MKLNTLDMPKIESPFVREIVNGEYVCIPQIQPEYRWVFENSIAVDKLDGTNVSVEVRNRNMFAIRNREAVVDIWEKGNGRFYNGIKFAFENQYFNWKGLADGIYYGELIGPKIQGNPYQLEEERWVPFSYLQNNYVYKFWPEYLKTLRGKTDGEIYESMSDLFKNLWSIYKRQRGITGEVNEDTKFEGLAAEGIVFYSPEGKMAKLRRDMFDWFTGRRH